MKQLIILLGLSLIIISCTNNSKGTAAMALPSKPASIDAVLNIIKQKNYKAEKIATLSPFEMDKENPYDWFDEKKDTSSFAKRFLNERLSMKLQFKNDTAVLFIEDNKTIEGTYKLDTIINEEEKPGIKFRISYPDSSMSFPGVTEPMIMTYTFNVLGIDEKNLMLETPRSYNNRKIAVLLKAE
jgi:hypothetical protein